MKKALLLTLLFPVIASAETGFSIDECIIKNDSNTEADILKNVSVQEIDYITYSYFLTDGKLVQGQDYGKKPKAAIHENYSKVLCPKHQSTFSPEKYLDKNS